MPTFDGIGFRAPDTNKSMGIEIECCVASSMLNQIHGAFLGFFRVAYDPSINAEDADWGYHGREFVSQPLPAEWLKKEIGKLGKKISWKTNHTCGVHVHVSRKWLSEKKAKAIFDFLCKLESDHTLLTHWFGRKPNLYCRMTPDNWKLTRYCAINTQPSQTIEFRMFSSGGPDWCKYCVDMVKYLIDQAYILNVDAVNAFRDQYQFP